MLALGWGRRGEGRLEFRHRQGIRAGEGASLVGGLSLFVETLRDSSTVRVDRLS